MFMFVMYYKYLLPNQTGKIFFRMAWLVKDKRKKAMHIQHEESDIRGRHFINDDNGNMLAEITYAVQHPDTMVVDHTEVSEELKGKNIGYQLVGAVVEHARAKGRKVIAVCPFAHAVMLKNKDFQDVMAEENPAEQNTASGSSHGTVYDPARLNQPSPAPGMAAVNTFNPDEMESGARPSSTSSE
jgi:uncharacterized protein